MKKIKHKSLLKDIKKSEEYLSKREGVPVKYVATTCLDSSSREGVRDIFYRETPHINFGNRYFGLFKIHNKLYICDADKIEDLNFGMVENDKGDLEYSSHRHDYKLFKKGTIDGGRAYVRGKNITMYKVKDGDFIKCQ